MEKARIISEKLAEWYSQNRRALPWRDTKDPYRVWLSEIILQQTRVEQGTPYYLRFIQAFPNVHSLASAPEDEVLKQWQGLGYYSRARNLHESAKKISEHFDGVFPDSFDELIKLKGVGTYTAAAISSIAFDEPKAVVDGNVIRVISRLFRVCDPINRIDIQKRIQLYADELLDSSHPGEHNQAIMDFGAMQCTPKNPDCGICPFKNLCVANVRGQVQDIPLKTKKTKKTDRFFNFLILQNSGEVALEKRGEKDIWAGLYQFPLIELSENRELNLAEVKTALCDLEHQVLAVHDQPKHVLSHQNIYTKFYRIEMLDDLKGKYSTVKTAEVHRFALPRLIDKYLEKHGLD